MGSKLVKEMMTPVNKLVFLSPSDTVERAHKIMREKGIHSVLVSRTRGRFDLRIFTYKELREFWALEIDSNTAKLERHAKIIEQVAEPDWTCEECRSHLDTDDHLIVLDPRGNLLGLISISDIDNNC